MVYMKSTLSSGLETATKLGFNGQESGLFLGGATERAEGGIPEFRCASVRTDVHSGQLRDSLQTTVIFEGAFFRVFQRVVRTPSHPR